MGQLQCALEVSDFTGQHEASALHQALLEELRVEEGRRHLGPPIAKCDNEILAFGRSVRPLRLGLGDDVDEGHMLTFLELLTLSEHRHPVDILTRVMTEQIVDRANPEMFLQRARGLFAEDVLEPVGQHGHGYSTPISNASPRWSV